MRVHVAVNEPTEDHPRGEVLITDAETGRTIGPVTDLKIHLTPNSLPSVVVTMIPAIEVDATMEAIIRLRAASLDEVLDKLGESDEFADVRLSKEKGCKDWTITARVADRCRGGTLGVRIVLAGESIGQANFDGALVSLGCIVDQVLDRVKKDKLRLETTSEDRDQVQS